MNNKQIALKDVLHLYIGCEMKDFYNDKIGKFVSYCISTEKVFVLHKEQYKLNLEEVKLILRPLIDSEITKEEYKYIWEELNTTAQMLKDDIKMKPELFLYLIKQGFDLFGLLQSHQAIRK